MKINEQEWRKFRVEIVNKGDKNYPKKLLDLRQPPKQIHYRGELKPELFGKTIGIVGSRGMTRYGASVVEKFVSSFALAGVTTISGYMYGVDAAVHAQTIENGGVTIAIMGGGINQPYPPENDKLYTKILQSGGMVLSEYDPEMKPKLWTYPQRNRIIAALSTIGVLVIEASEKSGSLITVQHAQKLRKKIYAIPGPITSSVSTGTNYLIKEGIAELAVDPSDILKSVKKISRRKKTNHELGGLEKQIYETLEREDMNLDEIIIAINSDMVAVSTALSMMSLRGMVSEAGGRYFVV